MNKQDKQLLLQDLCARLPYGVKGKVYAETTNGDYDINGGMIFYDCPFDVILDEINSSTEEIHVVAIGNEDTVDFIEDQQVCGVPYTIDEFMPYLRPLSSMTEEEFVYFMGIRGMNLKSHEIQKMMSENFSHLNSIAIVNTLGRYSHNIDWLNKNMFDYRGLIPKGIALEAHKDMYK